MSGVCDTMVNPKEMASAFPELKIEQGREKNKLVFSIHSDKC